MKLAICAGHSDSSAGAFANGHSERDLMTQFRDIVARKLRERGHTVWTDGDKGRNLPLKDAVGLIRTADLGVEFHTNAGSAAARGVETFSLPRHKALSQSLSQAIAAVLDTTVRGEQGWKDQKDSQHKSLAVVNAGGLLVETFFLTNKQELDSYLARYWLVAEAVAKTLDEHYGSRNG